MALLQMKTMRTSSIGNTPREAGCGDLEESFSVRSGFKVAGYLLERCLSADASVEVWNARAEESGVDAFVVDFRKTPSGKEQEACAFAQSVVSADSAHFLNCTAIGILKVGDQTVQYVVRQAANGTSLESLLDKMPGEPPSLLSNLQSAFALVMDVFNAVNTMLQPSTRGVRHFNGQMPTDQIMVTDGGSWRFVDYSTSSMCCEGSFNCGVADIPVHACSSDLIRSKTLDMASMLFKLLLFILVRRPAGGVHEAFGTGFGTPEHLINLFPEDTRELLFPVSLTGSYDYISSEAAAVAFSSHLQTSYQQELDWLPDQSDLFQLFTWGFDLCRAANYEVWLILCDQVGCDSGLLDHITHQVDIDSEDEDLTRWPPNFIGVLNRTLQSMSKK
mmetsp:Transcript_103098/g.290008  ORF Transcript_103098/g.290008 Transcript_103098/m.290008 type:complete len:389 (-) Transcript_103098:285-1451(-)